MGLYFSDIKIDRVASVQIYMRLTEYDCRTAFSHALHVSHAKLYVSRLTGSNSAQKQLCFESSLTNWLLLKHPTRRFWGCLTLQRHLTASAITRILLPLEQIYIRGVREFNKYSNSIPLPSCSSHSHSCFQLGLCVTLLQFSSEFEYLFSFSPISFPTDLT